MKGKSYSIPFGMVFKKYYCHKCGCKLKKERTHRIVSKDDKDYYQYHDVGLYPSNDYDVYEYRFMCPSCNNKISYEEQCIIKRIQRKCDNNLLSTSEISLHYDKEKKTNKKYALLQRLIIPNIFFLVFFALYFFLGTNKTVEDLLKLLILFLIMALANQFIVFRHFKGKNTLRRNQDYSYDSKAIYRKLHTYSSNNKELIKQSKTCYCFYCKKQMNPTEIQEYIDNNQTALCPYCEIDSILPDAIDEPINDELVDEMNKYWF